MIDQLWEQARHQGGLVRRRQVLASGLSTEALRHRLTSGRWQRVLPGVYATFSGEIPEPARHHAALLFAGEGAQLAGLSACRKYGLRYVPPDDGRVHVLVGHDRRPGSTAFVAIRRARTLSRPRHVAGLAVCPPARAVIDACRQLTSQRAVRALMADAVNRKLVHVQQLERELEAGCSAGSALPRRALEDVRMGCRSAPECEVRDLVKQSTVLPEPLWNTPVTDKDGHFLGYPDGLWWEALLALEVNSREWHLEGDAFEATMKRSSKFAAAGILVIPVSPSRIRREGAAVLAELEAAYLTRLGPGTRGTPAPTQRI